MPAGYSNHRLANVLFGIRTQWVEAELTNGLRTATTDIMVAALGPCIPNPYPGC